MTGLVDFDGFIAQLVAWPRAAILLDYDGTLVPIEEVGERASPGPDLVRLIGRLARSARVRSAIVSGRPVAQLRRWLDIDGLTLVGLHGAEMRTPDGRLVPLVDAGPLKRALRPVAKRAQSGLPVNVGLVLEDKGIALELHFRRAPAAVAARAAHDFQALARPLTDAGGFRLAWGRKALELTPVSVNKGRAVLRLLDLWRHPPKHTVYFGDAASDEDAFHALGPSAWTVLVSETDRLTHARFRTLSHAHVVRLLSDLCSGLEDGTEAPRSNGPTPATPLEVT